MFANFSLFKTPFPGWSSLPTSFVSFLSFIFFPTCFQRQWAAFLGAWYPLPAFRSCFVEFTQHWNVLLMNLLGRKWSPCPIPLPSWVSVIYLDLFCASISKTHPKVVASSPYTNQAYERFPRNTLLSHSRRNCTNKIKHFLVIIFLFLWEILVFGAIFRLGWKQPSCFIYFLLW